jgi:thiamine biosynthesis lipoprotein
VVGVQDPRDDRKVLATVTRSSGSVATSGTAARGAHLYDPRTRLPSTSRWASVTVVGPSLERADVLATAAFVAGSGWAELLTTDYVGLAVDAEGSLHPSPGWTGA